VYKERHGADAVNAGYCYLQPKAARTSDQFCCYIALSVAEGKDLAGLLAVLSLHLTAKSATAVRFCTPAAARGHV
jgi:hypothetical protein